MIRFLRRSIREIRHSVETYLTKTIIVPCQRCSNHVSIRVMGFLAEPDKPVEIRCENCDHTVCFTTKQPLGQAGPGYSWPMYTEEPLSMESFQQVTGTHNNRTNSNFYGSSIVENSQPFPHTLLASSKPVPLTVPKSKRNIPKRKPSVSFSDNLQTFYGGQNSTSNDSSSEYLEDQDSVMGQYSHRSSISLSRRPSTSQPNILLGLEQCGEKDGHALEYLPIRRGSGDSIDLTSGRVEMRAAGKNDQFQAHLFAMDLDIEKNPESAPASDSDPGSIRGGISDKRRGKMPMRPNSIHRAAIARRHSQKIEQQEQYEAETLNAKRRNSLNSDFEVEPSDEEVRQAYRIYTAPKDQQCLYQESDIQWARGILRTRRNWEKLRYEHPLGGSMEQLQIKIRNGVESAHPPGPIRHPMPFTISTPPNMSPRISRLSLHLPTSVKEEPEGDICVPATVNSFNLSSPRSSGSVPRPSDSLGTPVIGPGRIIPSAVELPSTTAGVDGRNQPNDNEQSYTGSTNPPMDPLQESQGGSNRWRNILKSVTRRVSCFHESARPISPSLRPLAPSTENQQLGSIPPSLGADPAPYSNPLSHGQPRSSGEIFGRPTTEEPLVLVGQEITGLVGPMRTPLVQIQFDARPEDLFAR